jgi:cytochrome P450
MSDTTQQTTAIKYDAGFDEIIAAMASPEFRQNPYDLYRRLRREYPVYRSSQGAWYLTRYADVDGALRNPQLSRDRERILRWQAQLGLTKEDSELQQSLSQSMLNADPPDHTRLRNLVNQAFTPRRVEALRPWIETMVDQLLDTAVAAGPSMDLIAALAEPLPVMVICELLGVPDADRHHISEWTQQFIDQASYAPTREALQHSAQVLCAFEDYLRELIRRRRAHPGDDLISALVTMQERGDHLTEDELLGTCFLAPRRWPRDDRQPDWQRHARAAASSGSGTATAGRSYPDQQRSRGVTALRQPHPDDPVDCRGNDGNRGADPP